MNSPRLFRPFNEQRSDQGPRERGVRVSVSVAPRAAWPVTDGGGDAERQADRAPAAAGDESCVTYRRRGTRLASRTCGGGRGEDGVGPQQQRDPVLGPGLRVRRHRQRTRRHGHKARQP